jgi:hypothetical protein
MTEEDCSMMMMMMMVDEEVGSDLAQEGGKVDSVYSVVQAVLTARFAGSEQHDQNICLEGGPVREIIKCW